MHEFRDAKNRVWRVDLNCDSVQRVKDVCGCNILDLVDTESALYQEVLRFPVLVARLVYVLCLDQVETAKVDETDFRRAMNGDALGDAAEALRAEIVNFSPRSTRPLMEKMLAKQHELEAKGMALAMARLEDPAISEALEEKIRRDMDEALSSALGTACLSSAGGPAAAPASTPDASLGDSSS
jgi:hypothetical protein